MWFAVWVLQLNIMPGEDALDDETAIQQREAHSKRLWRPSVTRHNSILPHTCTVKAFRGCDKNRNHDRFSARGTEEH